MLLSIFFSKNKSVIFFWSFLNALVMLWVTFFMLRIPYVLPDEFMLVQATSVTKNLLLGFEEKPDTNRFLFVNVAWDKVMSNRYDPDIPGYVVGKEPITDRAKLVGLLKLLEKNPNHEFIVLDIFFKGTTEHDEELVRLINKIPRLLVSYHRDQNDKPDPPDLPIKPLGLSDIETVDDKCLKFKVLHNDSLKSTPLLMYEKIHKQNFYRGIWFYFLGDNPVLNSFILDYRIRNYDYSQKRYASVNLGEWINIAYKIPQEFDWSSLASDESTEGENTEEIDENAIDSLEVNPTDTSVVADTEVVPSSDSLDTADTTQIEEEMQNFEGIYDLEFLDEEKAKELIYPLTKNRIVFVGDFEDRDIHETIYGDTPGPIILLDAFLALESGDNLLRPIFLVLLLFLYTLISYLTFAQRTIYGSILQKLANRTKATFFESLTIYLVYFAVISIFSYFFFNIHIGVLILAFYMYFIEKVKGFFIRRMERKAMQQN